MSGNTRSRGRLLAFTLIELLVVISIIALLIALLLPAIKSARESARAAICMSNERQIYLGYNSYAGDYSELVPPTYNGSTWARTMLEYLPSAEADSSVGYFFNNNAPSTIRTFLHCPSEKTHGGPVLRFGQTTVVYGNIREDYAPNILRSGRCGYGGTASFPWGGYKGGKTNFFTLVVESGLYRKQMYVGLPSDTFLLADGNYMDHEPTHNAPVTAFGVAYRHHSFNSASFVFFDGHAEHRPYQIPNNDYPGHPDGNDMPVEEPW